jgi:hypothetical protein
MGAVASYFARIDKLKAGVVRTLMARGVGQHYLKFGGHGDKTAVVRVPTDARSEFLANRAMGDWAERTLAAAIHAACPDLRAVHYGNSDRIAAGEDGFRDFYISRMEDVRIHGKRPDLLITPIGVPCAADVSGESTESLRPLVRQSRFAIEVRSSKFEALRYMKVRSEQKSSGRVSGRDAPSFTVKVEDLRIVFRWLEQFDKPQSYVQVFFDSIFAINFVSIFEIISSGSGFKIEFPANSQAKATIMIPITSGKQIGAFESLPTFTAEERVTKLGRHDAYVRPIGGVPHLDRLAMLAILSG